MKRPKRVAPGTRTNLADMSLDEVVLSLNYMADLNFCKDALEKFRRQCEADGKDPFQILACVVAHNWAVDKRTLRGKAKGAAAMKAQAATRRAEILKQLSEARDSVKSVAIDRQSSGLPARSERTIRRVKKSKS